MIRIVGVRTPHLPGWPTHLRLERLSPYIDRVSLDLEIEPNVFSLGRVFKLLSFCHMQPRRMSPSTQLRKFIDPLIMHSWTRLAENMSSWAIFFCTALVRWFRVRRKPRAVNRLLFLCLRRFLAEQSRLWKVVSCLR